MIRPAVALAALLAVTGTGHTFAAPKAVCLLLQDATGDGLTEGQGPNRPAIDIVSADVATGRSNLVAVLRLASVADDPSLAPGAVYVLGWRAGGVEQQVSLRRYAGGVEGALFDPNTAKNGDEQQIAVSVHPPTSSIIWTVPRKLNPALAKKGARIDALTAEASPEVNPATPSGVPFRFSGSLHFVSGDDAASRKTYVDLTPSCVKGT